SSSTASVFMNFASMGPRTLARGNLLGQFKTSLAAALQWGRALSRAEITLLRLRRINMDLLQWGRALSRAEIRNSFPRLQKRVRFNGAAHSRARKFDEKTHLHLQD